MDHAKSDNIKLFLENKLKECVKKINKMKRKRKIVKIIYGTTIIVSVSASTLAAVVAGFFSPPILPVVITSLSTVGAISTAISTKFNLKSKQEDLNNMIIRLDRIKQQMHYVIACNGSLTESDSKDIIKEFL